MKESVNELSKRLKNMHKRFLELERREAEVNFEQRLTPFAFLQMLTQDKRFSWMLPLSALIAEMDALVDENENVTQDDFDRIHAQIKEVLSADHSRIARRLKDHLEKDPEFFLAMESLNEFVNIERPPKADLGARL